MFSPSLRKRPEYREAYYQMGESLGIPREEVRRALAEYEQRERDKPRPDDLVAPAWADGMVFRCDLVQRIEELTGRVAADPA